MNCPTCGEVEHQADNPDDYRHCPCFDGTQWEMANCECACHSTAIVHRSTYTSKGAQLLRGAKGLVVWTPEGGWTA